MTRRLLRALEVAAWLALLAAACFLGTSCAHAPLPATHQPPYCFDHGRCTVKA